VSSAAGGRTRGLVIAIDGPSGAGKSTAGRALAGRLGYVYVDTGAMYRALALKALRAGVPLDDERRLVDLSRDTRIELAAGSRGVFLDGSDVTADVRTRDVSVAASKVSVHPGVRRDMVARQRAMGGRGGVVLDGRDIGTAVFPEADVKFYVDADPTRRAGRRHLELREAGSDVALDQLERELRDRDHADTHRADSPLVRASDAITLDTTEMTREQVVERMLEIVRKRG
jgi:CMP/dCMP kinase